MSNSRQHDLKISTVSDIYDVFKHKGERLVVADFTAEGIPDSSMRKGVQFGYLKHNEDGTFSRTGKGFRLMDWADNIREELKETRKETKRIKAARLARS